MKKTFILLMMSVVVLNISAQNINESQKNDSLQYQLNELQHKYDYLDCVHRLNNLSKDLSIYTVELKLSINSLSISFYHGGYDGKIYQVEKENYEVSKDKLDSIEELIYWTKLTIMQKEESANFDEYETNVLKSSLETIDAGFTAAETALMVYKNILNAYRESRF